MKVVALAGGFGGARFARALAESDAELTVIGNVGDDEEILGLHISPDLDSILYALAGIGDEERGWGRADETWNALDTVGALGGDTWFQLGDRDLGLHLLRTQALRNGEPLSSITARFAARARYRRHRAARHGRRATNTRRDPRGRLRVPGVVRGPAPRRRGDRLSATRATRRRRPEWWRRSRTPT